MVGCRACREEFGRGVRCDEGGQALTRAVYGCEVVAHIDRYAAKHRTYILKRGGHLQEVANDDRNTEARTRTRSAAEGQRECKASIVHAVKEAPQAVPCAEDPSTRKGAGVNHSLEKVRAVVVVADEQRSVSTDRGLGTAGQEAWRVPQRQQSGGDLVAAGELHEALPGGNEFGHVVRKHPPTCSEVGSRGRALTEVPAVVGVASHIVQGLPTRAGLILTYAVQRHGVRLSKGAEFWSHSSRIS